MGSKLVASLLFLVVLVGSPCAIAAPTPAERETARRLMDEGKARQRANDHQRAIEAFHKANEIMHVPTTALALAKAHAAAGHLVEARDAALEVSRLPRESGEPTVFEHARRQAKDLETQLKGRIPTVRIRVKGGVPTKLAIDEVEVPTSVLGEPVAVNPGKRVVTARAEGLEGRSEIDLLEHDHRELELTLVRPDPSAKPPPSGASGAAGAASTMPPGATFAHDDVDVVHIRQRQPIAGGLIYGGITVGVIGLIVGAVTGSLALSTAADVKQSCENGICAPEARNDLDGARTLATVATIGFGAIVAGGAAALIGVLLPKSDIYRKKAWLVGPGAVGGTF
jgi:hypothetical protein